MQTNKIDDRENRSCRFCRSFLIDSITQNSKTWGHFRHNDNQVTVGAASFGHWIKLQTPWTETEMKWILGQSNEHPNLVFNDWWAFWCQKLVEDCINVMWPIFSSSPESSFDTLLVVEICYFVSVFTLFFLCFCLGSLFSAQIITSFQVFPPFTPGPPPPFPPFGPGQPGSVAGQTLSFVGSCAWSCSSVFLSAISETSVSKAFREL